MLKALLASLALFLSAASALAEDWPNKPITVLMGFPAGSGVDVVARMLQPSLEKSLGQRLVLDYKTGAGGNVASEVVANAPGPTATPSCWAPRRRTASIPRSIPGSASTSRPTSRRSRPWSTSPTC